ncbi:MAG: hypothetical protein M3400_16645 [Actinomycetota bacterium]|nr:hypothetical protein [Actinomycetota bacterium]
MTRWCGGALLPLLLICPYLFVDVHQPPEAQMGNAQADVTFVSQDLNLLGNMTMTTFPDADPVLFEGTLSDLIHEQVIELSVEISQENISLLSLSESDGTLVLNDDEGNASDYVANSYLMQTAIEDRYEIHSGVWTDPDGNTFDFIASTDPVPTIVIVIAIGAATCLAIIGIQALINDCQSSQQANIQACAAAGGLPSLRTNVIFGFGTDTTGGWRLGCSHECSVQCRSQGTP